MVQGRQRSGRILLWGLSALVAMAIVPALASARGLTTGITGIKSGIPVSWALDHTVDANATLVRVGVSWRLSARREPAQPKNPADPAYDWSQTDGLVSAASQRGLKVLLAVARAPDWAEGKGDQHETINGTWKPNAKALGDFAHALASRYSGVGHPRVRYFDVWNEPNIAQYLQPQWKRVHHKRKPASPKLFAKMAKRFYAGVKSANKGNLVVAPSTSPYGDSAKPPYPFGEPRMRPLSFMRKALCLKRKHGKLRPKKKHCKHLKFDIASQHPVDRTRSHGPNYHAKNRDDVGPGDMGRVKRVVRAAERFGTVRPRHKRRPLWVTEFWRASNPPDPGGLSLQTQARWIEQGLYTFWKAGVSTVIYQTIADPGGVPGTNNWQSGLFFHNLTPKPAYTAFRFPFVVTRQPQKKVSVWGQAPANGKVMIERLDRAHWKTVQRIKSPVKRRQIFQTTLRVAPKSQLRARVGRETSLPWKL